MTTMPAEANFSELINKPKDTVARLQGNVRKGLTLHRRDGEDLYLTTAERAGQVTELVGSTARLLLALLQERDPYLKPFIIRVFRRAYPWVSFLPDDAVREFLAEFAETADAAAELESVAPLAPVISSWKAMAEAYSDPALYKKLRTPSDGDGFGEAEPPPAE